MRNNNWQWLHYLTRYQEKRSIELEKTPIEQENIPTECEVMRWSAADIERATAAAAKSFALP